MLVLGIDTSTKVATAALVDGKQLLGETFVHTGNNHSQHLLPLVDGLLKLCQVQPSQLNALAVALGPGSFTGLRIGLATGKGLAGALDIPLLGVPTLDGLAWNLAGVQGIVCPILDARKKQVYAGLYKWAMERKKMDRLGEHLVITPEALAAKLLAEIDPIEPIYFLGDAVPVYREVLVELLEGRKLVFAHQPNSLARGAQIAWLGLEQLRTDTSLEQDKKIFHSLTPLYLRSSEAELNLKQKLELNN